ncbi:MAG: cytochrome b N-terminal domain-containing protein [Hydrococcus sp. Prado102]|jgi:cytochrome b6|nr:cytochrome b N-terminal domain-containing protein [Hydrococcus sp. Prado102]
MDNIRYNFIVRRLATLGAIATLTLCFLAAVSGVLLAFYYSPSTREAFASIERISTEVPNGWLIRSLHDIAGNGLIVVSLVQIVVMFLGRQFRLGWLTAWISGIFLTLSAIALSWTAMNLEWTQTGYWRLTLELGIIESIPAIGHSLREFLTGGEGIGTITLQHLFTLHSYVLSIVATILSIVHLIGLLIQERQEKQLQALAIETDTPKAPQQNQSDITPPASEIEDDRKFNPSQGIA